MQLEPLDFADFFLRPTPSKDSNQFAKYSHPQGGSSSPVGHPQQFPFKTTSPMQDSEASSTDRTPARQLRLDISLELEADGAQKKSLTPKADEPRVLQDLDFKDEGSDHSMLSLTQPRTSWIPPSNRIHTYPFPGDIHTSQPTRAPIDENVVPKRSPSPRQDRFEVGCQTADPVLRKEISVPLMTHLVTLPTEQVKEVPDLNRPRAKNNKQAPPDPKTPKEKPQKKKKRKLTGFKRANDIDYLHEGYDKIEEQLKRVKGLKKACKLGASEKQRVWNQISSLKNRLKTREHQLCFRGLAHRKEKLMASLVKDVAEVASRRQLIKILTRVEEKWSGVDATLDERYPVDVQSQGLLFKGEIRPRIPSSDPENAQEQQEEEKVKWPKTKVKGTAALIASYKAPDFIFEYFQRNGEQEGLPEMS